MKSKKPLVVYPEFRKQSFEKVYNYLQELVVNEEFQKRISDLRVKYEIPSGGFKRLDFDGYKNWKEKYCKYLRKEFDRNIRALCGNYNLYFVHWDDVIVEYILCGYILPIEELGSLERHFGGSCVAVDLKWENTEIGSGIVRNAEDDSYPIAIRISPYASKRDILDYIKKSYSEIAEIQAKYKNLDSLQGKVRSKKLSIKRRNDFIYQYRNLPLSKIRDNLGEMDIWLDSGEINTIIKDQIKRRNRLL